MSNISAAGSFVCKCDNQDHPNATDCERYEKLMMHLDITIKIAPFSKTVPVIISPSHHTFHLQKDLLTLHSGFFKGKLADLELVDEANQLIKLTNVEASEFAEFACWIHSYKFAPIATKVLHQEAHLLAERLWQLGYVLQAPGFQNFAMHNILSYCQDDEEWPLCSEVASIYEIAGPGSKLRLFAAHSVFCKTPGETHKDYDAWEKLMTDNEALAEDICSAETRKRKWEGTLPWDGENRHIYMEKEKPLDHVWEMEIIEKRSLRQIKEAVIGGCPRSIFELDHLERNFAKKGKTKA